MTGINKVIRTLIVSDFFLQCGWGLIGPIFAIFITQQINGGTLAAVGLIAATFWFVKSVAQPFIAHYLDVKKGEKDDFNLLVFGMFFANLIPLAYIFTTELWHIFLLEAIRGLCMACVLPSWAGIFTRHIDRGWEAFSWSIESTTIGFAFSFAAAFGGILATFLGFKIIFVLISLFGLGATFLLFFMRNHLFHRDGFVPRVPPTEKPF